MSEVSHHQLDIVRRMEIDVRDEPRRADLVIDAILGYSLQGDPRGRAAELIGWCLAQSAPVCSLDTPSGLDVTTGEPRRPCVRATATLTIALPKAGLARASDNVGVLFVGDISVPPALYERLGLGMPHDLFADGPIVRLR
jgi:NAD(P)H-hydrate epimerase